MGTRLGDNTIVGAGAVVKGEFPPNVVIAGTPARIVCTLEEFYERRKRKSLQEAFEYIRIFKHRFGRLPKEDEMRAWFPLFLERTPEAIERNHINLHLSGDDYEEILDDFLNSKPAFPSLASLCEAAMEDERSTGN